MKKGYYIHFDARRMIGVSKKIDMQIKELNKKCRCTEIELFPKKRIFLQRIIGLLPCFSLPWNYEYAFSEIDKPDYIYLRRVTADRNYILFLKKIKQRYPDCKIIVELPTYPYDYDNFAKWDAWPFWIKDKFYRRKYKQCIDAFATYTKDEDIFGVETIKTMNGIDVSGIKPAHMELKKNRIDLIAVAFMQKHHGYERVLEGLIEYYKKSREVQVYIHLVGKGPELEKYKNIVEKGEINDYVIFYGNKVGKELDELYNGKDFGVVSLGMYKLKINSGSVLKSREYLAKGLPMILGCDIDIFEKKHFPYYIQFPNDASTIDIEKIVEFYKTMIETKDSIDIVKEIRSFAYENVDISVTMKPILDYILN